MLSRYRNLRRETHLLSSGKTEEILSLLRQVLEPQNVFKVVIESGQPVLVYREKDEAGPLDEEDISLDGALRNAELIEYINPGASSFETVFDMHHVLLSERMNPVCWAMGAEQGYKILENWFDLDGRGLPRPDNPDKILGVPLFRLKSLPPDAILLCGSSREEGEIQDVEFAVKATIEMRTADEPSREADRPGRDDSRGNPPTALEMETPPPREPRGGWDPASVPRIWMGNR